MIISADQAKIEKEKEKAKDESDDSDESDDNDKNSGTMIVDATCAPSQITYPQDVSLLNKARECSEKNIDELHEKAIRSRVPIARRLIKTTHPTPAAESLKQSKPVKRSASSLVISKGT